MSWTKLRARTHGLLWFGEEQKDRWSSTDPESDELFAAVRRLRPTFFDSDDFIRGVDPRTPEEKQRDSDVLRLFRVVDDYRYLTTYELGVEHIIKKLRAIWRALEFGMAAELRGHNTKERALAEVRGSISESIGLAKAEGGSHSGLAVKSECIDRD